MPTQRFWIAAFAVGAFLCVGAVAVSPPELQFSITLDRATYTANMTALMTARLTLRNTTDKPVRLAFPSGQRYDLELKNERGDVVCRWSDGKAFPMMVSAETIEPGERHYVITVRLADKAGKPLPPGSYVAEAWLTTMEPRTYVTTAGFRIASGSRPR